ncbi:sugar-transfer associated ATP-grasp domain-containing protein [Butyrivibrio sp. VCB2006]|uniref:sugar-transfer associated ATP-grasp domain-containing protein n=1 Tax=Butyrivibrio sp. VCB2006 TaxID=1280679 RepID=UPI00040DC967|nr:sugar-transfer associated ATP-grasp domain-containing protein [Butyrivibrio sp. VCB2006]
MKMNWKYDYYKLMITRLFKGRFLNRGDYNTMVAESTSCKNTLLNKLDYILANVAFGVQPGDYFIYELYKYRNPFYRNHNVNRTRLIFMRSRLNDQTSTDFLTSKPDFYNAYNEYLGRKWCCVDDVSEEEFIKRLSSANGHVFVKPIGGYGGEGARKVSADENELRKLYRELSDSEDKYLVEEYYEQKGFFHDVNPSSLNTIRMITLKCDDKIELVYAFLRVGMADSIVDNLHSGGLSYVIDIKNGEILKGVNYRTNEVEIHPSTNTKVTGHIIPNWESVVDFTVKLHKMAPEGAHMIGWDICVSDDEIIVIEGNASPAFLRDVRFSDNTWKKLGKAMSAI